MRIGKIAAGALTVVGLFVGGSALADGLAKIQSFVGTETVGGSATFCITPSPEAVGKPCMFMVLGNTVGSTILAPGPNFVTLPYMGPDSVYTATGPMIEAVSTHPECPGIN
jgi:hypothetical protein